MDTEGKYHLGKCLPAHKVFTIIMQRRERDSQLERKI